MTVYNSIDKLSNRAVGELEDLSIIVLETSYKETETKLEISEEARDIANFNTPSKIKNRLTGELLDLRMGIVEASYRDNGTSITDFKVISPTKVYKNKIKIIKKYNNKVKY